MVLGSLGLLLARRLQHRNTAPLFFTARLPLTYMSRDVQEAEEYTTAMTERFVLRCWRHPLPMDERQVDFPACARCFAMFVLHAA